METAPTAAMSLVLVANKELLVKNQVLHQAKIELDPNHQWTSKDKEHKIKVKITKIKRKVEEIHISAMVIQNYQIQEVMDK